MERALQFEKFSNEFFLNVKDLLRRSKAENSADVSCFCWDLIIDENVEKGSLGKV